MVGRLSKSAQGLGAGVNVVPCLLLMPYTGAVGAA